MDIPICLNHYYDKANDALLCHNMTATSTGLSSQLMITQWHPAWVPVAEVSDQWKARNRRNMAHAK